MSVLMYTNLISPIRRVSGCIIIYDVNLRGFLMTNMWGGEEFNEKPILFLKITFKLVFCKIKKLIEMYRFFIIWLTVCASTPYT